MHPRNRYINPPDFDVLAFKYPTFRKHVRYDKENKACIDFHDPDAVRELSYTLLKHDFGLYLEIPNDALCPMVPNRLNYIHWIEDLICDVVSSTEDVYGIDIGTGASCIYPLLGCALNANWKFLATDTHKRLLEAAMNNVEKNNLSDRITLLLNSSNRKLPIDDVPERDYAFCMCNPPFYESVKQYETATANKKLPPSSTCTSSQDQMVTPGGEYQFIKDILEESLVFRKRISWYTSMIGRLETVDLIVAELKKHKIDNFVLTEFVQGRTRRWGIGWSFGNQRPPMSISQPTSRKLRHVKPPISEFVTTWHTNPTSLYIAVTSILTEAHVTYQRDSDSVVEESNDSGDDNILCSGAVFVETWSRKARRKIAAGEDITLDIETDQPLFKYAIRLEKSIEESTEAQGEMKTKLTVSWVWGDNRNIFESFYLHLKRRLDEKFKKQKIDKQRVNPVG
ncbi:5015_t:CDS:10 [Paraglomus occultum]|uniref:U6 small nuclear RNA (adenine-(43)-N(6))-methyltransferase n=1 Tax=Paraglomus occultum TaxID=144539 RepID=A0A9N9GBC5_9GLOM|nr:5015_t:CDS:10 [Paraglomus occultum]